MKKLLLVFVFSIFLVGIFVSCLHAGDKLNFMIENFRTDETTHKETWGVLGLARNLTGSPVRRCYVVIKFLNERGDIVHDAMASINSMDLIKSGQAAPFEYWANYKDFEGVTRFDIWVEAFGYQGN